VQFMAALLTQDMGNQDKTIKNITECREMGIKILPPDLNESQADFAVVEDGIRFGLAAVKNVGIKAVESIIEERIRSGKFRDLPDFCKRIEGSKVNRRVLEGLIQCGAFDFSRIRRSTLFASLDDVIRLCGAQHDPNQLNMFSSMNDPDSGIVGFFHFADVDEWSENEKLKKEKEALGFYITGHPLDEYKDEVRRFSTCTVQELMGLEDKSQVKVAGIIEDLKMKRTKRGERMAILTLEDQTGSTQVILFPDVFNHFSRFVKSDEPLLISGTAEVDNHSSKIIAREIDSLESLRQKAIRIIELTLNREKVTRDLLEEIRELFFKFPGDCPVLFSMSVDQGKEIVIAANNHYNVLPCEELLGEIEGITGQKVVCRYESRD
jgi:DNA polymerase-3 subunit alpha